MHPTQNRPPRAQAIKERRDNRERRRANRCWGATNTVLADASKPFAYPHLVKWTDAAVPGAIPESWVHNNEPTQEVTHG